MKKIIATVSLVLLLNGLKAQQDSCNIQISLLTCSPGEELYSTFGHSALRVIDHSTNTDIIYNYGTFDFDDPSFYSKFTRGKLLYFVSVQKFENYLSKFPDGKFSIEATSRLATVSGRALPGERNLRERA